MMAHHVLDACWGHYDDGSDLLVNESILFDIVYNTALRNIEKSIKAIDRITGGTCKNFENQCSCDSIYGGACKDSQKAFWEARKLVEEKGKRWNDWHRDK
ncbi:MAG: hypothetical protein HQK96_13980 [Nitrospirae bacterium]|nr:hypothetical protein [Nitrospirota bacterium]